MILLVDMVVVLVVMVVLLVDMAVLLVDTVVLLVDTVVLLVDMVVVLHTPLQQLLMVVVDMAPQQPQYMLPLHQHTPLQPLLHMRHQPQHTAPHQPMLHPQRPLTLLQLLPHTVAPVTRKSHFQNKTEIYKKK